MTRVDATSTNPDLLTAAFEGSGHSTLIVLNRSNESQRLKLDWAGQSWMEIERTSQRLENAVSSTVPSDLIVEPGEIVTLSNFPAN
jgi:hypothetical protein